MSGEPTVRVWRIGLAYTRVLTAVVADTLYYMIVKRSLGQRKPSLSLRHGIPLLCYSVTSHDS